jgi:EREBP-like factor
VPAVATCGYDLPSNLRINSNNNEEEEKRDGKGKYVEEEVQEVVGIPHAPTARSSSSPSSLSKEGCELSLWSSLDLPPICFNII